ncbi:MAG: hypothetical protein HOO91_00620 [Bacteroidales bacterium]|nr:hypothetical protein [Bacteroidales bacterium]
MIRKLKYIASLLLLLVFLLPSIEKLEHHHKHYIHNSKDNKQYPEIRENCYICDFQFSVFSTDFETIKLLKEKHLDNYCNNYSSFNYSNHSIHTFLLRAPPYRHI